MKIYKQTRYDAEYHKKLKRISDEENRSMATQLEYIIDFYLANRPTPPVRGDVEETFEELAARGVA